jgi:hypothetical protein
MANIVVVGVTLTLSAGEIVEALRDYVEKIGFLTTDRFSAKVTTIPGDRPTEATVSGVVVNEE